MMAGFCKILYWRYFDPVRMQTRCGLVASGNVDHELRERLDPKQAQYMVECSGESLESCLEGARVRFPKSKSTTFKRCLNAALRKMQVRYVTWEAE